MQGSKGKEAGVGRTTASLWNKLQLSHKELLGSTHWRYFIILTSQAYSHTEISPHLLARLLKYLQSQSNLPPETQTCFQEQLRP